MIKKKCTKCGRILDGSKFSKDKSRKDGLYSWCKECVSKYQKGKRVSLKLETMNAFGGRCVHMDNNIQCSKNSIYDLKDLDLIHPNDDGDEHRNLISRGQSGVHFYRALQKLGYDTGKFVVQVMCSSHHCKLDKGGKYGELSPAYKEGKFNDPAWLEKKYETISIRKIAKECGVSYQTIRNRMIKFGFSRRKPGPRP